MEKVKVDMNISVVLPENKALDLVSDVLEYMHTSLLDKNNIIDIKTKKVAEKVIENKNIKNIEKVNIDNNTLVTFVISKDIADISGKDVFVLKSGYFVYVKNGNLFINLTGKTIHYCIPDERSKLKYYIKHFFPVNPKKEKEFNNLNPSVAFREKIKDIYNNIVDRYILAADIKTLYIIGNEEDVLNKENLNMLKSYNVNIGNNINLIYHTINLAIRGMRTSLFKGYEINNN